MAIELERIRGEVAGTHRALPPESMGPFRGLGRFEESDRDVYFGRSSEMAAALELLRSNGLVCFVGASGSGKSSLARAGVLPRVQDGALGKGFVAWDVMILSPGRSPRDRVLAALASLPAPPFGEDETKTSSREPSEIVAALAARAQTTGRGALLFVDQLEELVTLADAEDPSGQRWLADLLVAFAGSSVAGVRGLVTARRDLLDQLLGLSGLGKALVRGTLLVEPMTDAVWGEVVRQALSAYGYRLEDDALAARLLVELSGTSAAMPLVQFALTELWNKRNTSEKTVTHAGLEAIGGIAGSLERHADETVARLVRSTPDAEARVRDVLLALTTPRGTRATVRSRALIGSDPARAEVVKALEEARLVVHGSEGITLAHDTLLVQWQRLRGWLAEVREERMLAEELERDAHRWALDPEGVSLWRKRRLATANDLGAATRVSLTEHAAAFLSASRSAELRARAFGVAIVVVMLSLVVAGTAVYVRSVRAGEAAAIERAELEKGKASIETAKRVELEQAQSELEQRQRRIDELVAKLAKADDPETIRDVQRQLADAQANAHAAQSRIGSVIPHGAPAHSGAPSTSSTSAPIGPKIQRDDE